MAVREGFEPSVPFDRYGALAKRCFRPLSHLTKAVARIWDGCDLRQTESYPERP
jgi:hypothetical protein